METKSWLWPDRTIGKRESRRLREEHNAIVNLNAELVETLRIMLNLFPKANIKTVQGWEQAKAWAVLAKAKGEK